jgi:phage shock protein E
MISIIKKLLGIKSIDLAVLIKNGTIVIDVRSPSEFESGHVKGAINIPVEQIGSQVEKLKKYSHIITCCRSGTRSGMAKMTLNAKGLNNVTNGGTWQNVNSFLN